MDLTPLDIYNKEFNRSFSLYSYDDAEVDAFLDRVAQAFEELYSENQELKEEMKELKSDIEQYKKMENSLQESLVMAQESVEEMKKNARREAELIKEEARKEAEEIIRESREEYRDKKRKLEEVEKHEQLFRIRFRSLLQSHLEMLDSEEEMATDVRQQMEELDEGPVAGHEEGSERDGQEESMIGDEDEQREH